MKPHGFWYGVDGDWQRFCESEMPQSVHPHNYAVDISRANILILGTVRAIVEFEEEFPNQENPIVLAGRADKLKIYSIGWGNVAARYDGIEIAPYQWKLRMDRMWYYPWDCASGCVWNTDKISITKMDKV